MGASALRTCPLRAGVVAIYLDECLQCTLERTIFGRISEKEAVVGPI